LSVCGQCKFKGIVGVFEWACCGLDPGRICKLEMEF
jgi:hypothetical protein